MWFNRFPPINRLINNMDNLCNSLLYSISLDASNLSCLLQFLNVRLILTLLATYSSCFSAVSTLPGRTCPLRTVSFPEQVLLFPGITASCYLFKALVL